MRLQCGRSYPPQINKHVLLLGCIREIIISIHIIVHNCAHYAQLFQVKM